MSVAEIKAELTNMSEDERLDVLAHLRAIACLNDPEWRAEMARRVADAKAGKGVSEEEVLRRLGISREEVAAARRELETSE